MISPVVTRPVLLEVLLNSRIVVLVVVVRAHLIPVLLVAGGVLSRLLQVLYRILVLNLRAVLVAYASKLVLVWRGLLHIRGLQAVYGGRLRLFLLEGSIYLAMWPPRVALDTLLEDVVVALNVLLVVIYILHSNNKY